MLQREGKSRAEMCGEEIFTSQVATNGDFNTDDGLTGDGGGGGWRGVGSQIIFGGMYHTDFP